jgi:hypothetical protein
MPRPPHPPRCAVPSASSFATRLQIGAFRTSSWFSELLSSERNFHLLPASVFLPLISAISMFGSFFLLHCNFGATHKHRPRRSVGTPVPRLTSLVTALNVLMPLSERLFFVAVIVEPEQLKLGGGARQYATSRKATAWIRFFSLFKPCRSATALGSASFFETR